MTQRLLEKSLIMIIAVFVTLHSCPISIFYSSFSLEVCEISSVLGRVKLSKGEVIIHMNVILHRLYKMGTYPVAHSEKNL